MAIDVFNRYEYKYIVDQDQFDQLRKVLNEEMELDKFCQKKIIIT